MLHNKIYQNFILEILKTFFVILFGLSVIALTVRAVNFLDLIVENGYPVSTYFKYSTLNLVGIAPKFIPFSFLLALTIFIIKHLQNSEFLILWTTGVKKIHLVNVFFFTSILTLLLYLFFSTILAPLSLNKSRLLLQQEEYNSILPTLRAQQFNDSFKGLVFFVDKKNDSELSNIFLQDNNNNFSNLSSNISKSSSTNIIAKKGIVKDKQLILLNGQIISSSKNDFENELIKFEQLNINLSNISTRTIKNPKLQETSTLQLFKFILEKKISNPNCNAKEEIITILNRRLVLPFYIPIIALISSLLLFISKKRFFNKNIIFIYSFFLLIFIELTVRHTGINSYLFYIFIMLPIILILLLYFFMIYYFLKKNKYK